MDTEEVFEILEQIPFVKGMKKKLNITYQNCFIALMVLHPKDPTRILIVDYYPDRDNPYFQIKFPGGTGEEDDETPFATLLREGKDEVLDGTPGAIIEKIAPVYRETKSARNWGETDHVRYGVVTQIEEKIQPFEHLEGLSNSEDHEEFDEKVVNHRYESVMNLPKILFRGHKNFLMGLCEALYEYIPEYRSALRELKSQGF